MNPILFPLWVMVSSGCSLAGRETGFDPGLDLRSCSWFIVERKNYYSLLRIPAVRRRRVAFENVSRLRFRGVGRFTSRDRGVTCLSPLVRSGFVAGKLCPYQKRSV
jgi:hypothetical protein